MSVLELSQLPTDVISSVVFSPDSNTLVVSSWDKDRAILIYRRSESSAPFELSSTIAANGPVLDLCFGANDDDVYAVGLDQSTARYSISGGAESREVLSSSSKPTNKVAYSREHKAVLSISWNCTLHIHDADSKQYIVLQLAAKPFALSLTADKAVVTMAERKVHVYALADLKTLVGQAGSTAGMQQPIPAKPWQERESSLKFMTRASATMPDGTGFAASSIEGRVGVEWFDEEANQKMYAFKCHRDKSTTVNAEGQEVPVDIIYPVNAIAFHPIHGTFATGGGDGVVALWDAKTKRRIRQYPKLPASVAAMDFSADGKMLAIGISPGFEDGKEEDMPDPELVKVYIREMGESEAKGKPAKEK
ncbi:putative WD40/YVTN repeat-like-containing domain superfamily [Septoria linicola]|nr:putative WD40/YVTN repeat-like-containing domain superfamily [Septoria linicola]